ncbi:MAG: response regulator [Candidatus Omnitrophica bacterium]|nr:response regulator [Candidatus Omnitrophota bacterium]MBU1923774.1 response regulator [Candidatus Omnitrophota bacterium]
MLYKVLVVDDEAPVRDLLNDLLKREDCKVSVCPTGEEALELLKKDTFDVVLLDIKLPGISGLEVLKNIRDTDKSLPVIMITGFGYNEDLISKSKEFGCSGYIGKNMPVAQIIEIFKQFTKNAKTGE